MTTSLKKEFDTYEDGIEELITILPDLKEYIGNNISHNEIVTNLLNIVKEEIPSVDNPNYPNTFSLTISAREVGFKTDDGMAFGWRIWLDKNNNNILGYQFRITFLTLPRNRRKVIKELLDHKWKEKTDALQSKFWDEVNSTSRNSNEKESIQTQDNSKNDDDVQDFPNKNDRDYSKVTVLPTFFQNSSDDIEDDVEEKAQEEFKPRQRPKLVGRSLLRPKLQSQEVVYQYDESENKEPEQISEMNEAQDIMESPRDTILQNGKVVEESIDTREEYTEDERGLIQLDPDYYSIRPGNTQAVVIIKFNGEETPINVLEQNSGIVRDLANKKLRIGRVVYDYANYTVFGLPEEYEPDNATYVENHESRIYQPIPDETFVPQETIRKYEDIDIEAIQEKAIQREERQARRTGIRPQLQWNRGNPRQQDNRPKVLRQGRAFVIDNPQEQKEEYTNQTQSVQITDEEPSRWR